MAVVDVARDKLDSGNMIRAWVEIAKILGIYAPETVKVKAQSENEVLSNEYDSATDNKLIAIAGGR